MDNDLSKIDIFFDHFDCRNSIAPSAAHDAPELLTINKGRIPKTISVEKSVKKLTRPKAMTLCNLTSLLESVELLSLFLVKFYLLLPTYGVASFLCLGTGFQKSGLTILLRSLQSSLVSNNSNPSSLIGKARKS